MSLKAPPLALSPLFILNKNFCLFCFVSDNFSQSPMLLLGRNLPKLYNICAGVGVRVGVFVTVAIKFGEELWDFGPKNAPRPFRVNVETLAFPQIWEKRVSAI